MRALGRMLLPPACATMLGAGQVQAGGAMFKEHPADAENGAGQRKAGAGLLSCITACVGVGTD